MAIYKRIPVSRSFSKTKMFYSSGLTRLFFSPWGWTGTEPLRVNSNPNLNLKRSDKNFGSASCSLGISAQPVRHTGILRSDAAILHRPRCNSAVTCANFAQTFALDYSDCPSSRRSWASFAAFPRSRCRRRHPLCCLPEGCTVLTSCNTLFSLLVTKDCLT